MNKIDVLLGLQWGDEGKGKIIDALTPYYDIIARFQGGPNAGHSLEFNGEKHVLHLIPSGIFHPGKINLLGNGMVIDPIAFKKEIEGLLPYITMEELKKRIVISDRAKLILPTHRLLDQAYEAAKGNGKIGTTGKGIGPTYTDHISRNSLRIGDTIHDDFISRYNDLQNKHFGLLAFLEYPLDSIDMIQEKDAFLFAIHCMQDFKIVNGPYWINQQLNIGKKILAEGAQGTLLDVDFGSYPFVTSSNTSCGGVCTGLGIAPNRIGKVYGLFKAYCTRVGSGPFPTELFDKTGKLLQKKGNEFGSTTGRARRCGWLDMPALKYACMINGVTDLVISKADVLSGFETVYVCENYLIDDKSTDEMPMEISESLKPQYSEFLGWGDISDCKRYDSLPGEFEEYLDFIEDETGIEINIISTGPDRKQIIMTK